MNRKAGVALALVSTLLLPLAAQAKIDKPAKDWQLKSLKGIKSIKYFVAFDADGSLLKTAEESFKDLKVPAKSFHVKDGCCESGQEIGANEGQLKVFVDNRDKDMAWVGLAMKQKSQLSRDGSVTYDADTYAIGSLVARSKEKETVKELCAKFKEDLKVSK